MMNNIIYTGPFKGHIQNYVDLKRALGYKYDANADHLKRFDRFTVEKYPKATVLTKKIVFDWCSKKTYEAQANQYNRACKIRLFGKYLNSIGVTAYIVPPGYYPTAKRYMPHIYTLDELTNFFEVTDNCPYYHAWPYRHLMMPVIFRMIYMCGLRPSEALCLKVADVDIVNGVLAIHHSKNDNSRLAPMSNDLTQLCKNFSVKVHLNSIAEDYFFPGCNDKSIRGHTLYNNFRLFLRRAGISHNGRGIGGPRIYDFRHTYAVHCLKKWVYQEKDLTVYLPVLKTYMGHESFNQTAYYLHLTADVFPDIALKMETKYPGIIPKLQGDSDETY